MVSLRLCLTLANLQIYTYVGLKDDEFDAVHKRY